VLAAAVIALRATNTRGRASPAGTDATPDNPDVRVRVPTD
jgi:hypothetical protein